MNALYISFFFLVIALDSAHSTDTISLSPTMQPPASSPTPNADPSMSFIAYPPGNGISASPTEAVLPATESSEFSGTDSISTESISDSASSNDVRIFSASLSSLSSTSVQDGGVGADPRVRKICQSTDYPRLCISTVTPFLNGKTDVTSVLEVAIKASVKLAKLGLSLARRVSEMPGTSPEIATMLKSCIGSYDDAVYNFDNAMNALNTRDVGTMNTMLSAVITDVGDCQDAFSGLISPLASYADKLTNMTSNCLAIVSLMQN